MSFAPASAEYAPHLRPAGTPPGSLKMEPAELDPLMEFFTSAETDVRDLLGLERKCLSLASKADGVCLRLLDSYDVKNPHSVVYSSQALQCALASRLKMLQIVLACEVMRHKDPVQFKKLVFGSPQQPMHEHIKRYVRPLLKVALHSMQEEYLTAEQLPNNHPCKNILEDETDVEEEEHSMSNE